MHATINEIDSKSFIPCFFAQINGKDREERKVCKWVDVKE